MTGIEDFNLVFIENGWLLFIFILVLALFSFFIYRYTLPKVTPSQKFVLTLLRSSIFALLLFVLFEPILSLFYKDEVEKKTFVFIDNSNSISVKDSSNRSAAITSFLENLNNNDGSKFKTFLFGDHIDSIDVNTPFKFDQQKSNFSTVSDFIKKRNAEINSVIILSDGIITDGIDPIYQFEKFQIPFFTIGVGDSTHQKDAEIYNVTYNQFIYGGKQTSIETIIKQHGLGNEQTKVLLDEENNLIDSRELTLNESGMNKISFSYSPKSGGEKKLRISVQPIRSEKNALNNSKTFFVNVLSSKIKVALIAGTPSSDLSAISSTQSHENNFEIHKFIQIAPNNLWSEGKNVNLDSADILFLVDFPSASTSSQFFNQVISQFEKNKPFFISISSSTDLSLLKQIEKYLPISTRNILSDIIQVQPELMSKEFGNYFSQFGNDITIWNNLPPINQLGAPFYAKPESNVIVRSAVRGVPLETPLIAVRSIGNQRSFCINGWNYWRWNLQLAEKNPDFFPNLFNEIVKWLNLAQNKKQFFISTNKKIFSPGEEIELTAELYDKAFNPIDTAAINLKVKQNQKVYDLSFIPAGNGIYNSSFVPDSQGDFIFEGKVQLNQEPLTSSGRFSVSTVSIEKIDTRMRTDYLQQIANLTGGAYLPIENCSRLTKYMAEKIKRNISIPLRSKTIELWNNKWLLFIIIGLFGLEWLIRKRLGMI